MIFYQFYKNLNNILKFLYNDYLLYLHEKYNSLIEATELYAHLFAEKDSYLPPFLSATVLESKDLLQSLHVKHPLLCHEPPAAIISSLL